MVPWISWLPCKRGDKCGCSCAAQCPCLAPILHNPRAPSLSLPTSPLPTGRAMASNETEAHKLMVKLDADYVLVIFGGIIGYQSDDINKFLWMVSGP